MLSWQRNYPVPYNGYTADTLSPTDWNYGNTPVYLSVYVEPRDDFYWGTSTQIYFEGRILPSTTACASPTWYF